MGFLCVYFCRRVLRDLRSEEEYMRFEWFPPSQLLLWLQDGTNRRNHVFFHSILFSCVINKKIHALVY